LYSRRTAVDTCVDSRGRSGSAEFVPKPRSQQWSKRLIFPSGPLGPRREGWQSKAPGVLDDGEEAATLRAARLPRRNRDRRKAIEHYQRFIELWRDCDPALGPMREEAESGLARLRA